MIAAWMLFAIEISAMLYAAAWLAERALLSARKPVRGVWLAAIVGGNVLPFVLSKVFVANILPASWTLAIGSESLMARLGTPLLVLWAVAAAIGLFVCASAVWGMSRARPLWKNEHVDNTPVLVSHDIGPALVGVMQYSIVVPQWAYSLEESARRLLLAHEREHARKYDPLLLAGAALTVVIAPWNVFNWLYFRRLHLAVELDCDQRVLRAHPDTRGYGALLLDVAERVLPSVMPAAAFVEHGASLETRINAMSEQKKRFRLLRVTGGLFASVLLAATACVMPRPYAIVVVMPPSVAQSPAQALTSESVPQGAQVQGQKSQEELAKAIADFVHERSAKGTTNSDLNKMGEGLGGPETRPVPPSARVRALDAAEGLRMRAIVAKAAPRVLNTQWTRADSALLLLFDADSNVVRQATVARLAIREGSDPLYMFNTSFMTSDVNYMSSASEFTIDRGARGEALPVPLKLFTAY
ncbi:MAG: M56 family metallopeptidase, partial [Gemmatimonadaceae bacterium]